MAADDRVVCEIVKNQREVVRVSLGEFSGHRLINVRIWSIGTSGKLVPTRSGVALKVAQLPELIAALERAWTEASR